MPHFAPVRVLVLSNHCHDTDRRDVLRAAAGLGVEIIVGTAGGAATEDGALRLVPIKTRGDAAQPGELRWDGRAIRRALTELRPELVHVEAEPESPLAVTLADGASRLGVPFVLHSSRSLPAALGFIARRRARKVLESAVGVIGANRRAMDLLHEQAPAGIAASIPATGVALPPLRTPGAGPLVAGFAGRLVPERGADLFFSALSQTYGKWDAVVAGTGPEQERLEAQVQQLGLAARIRWLGGIRQETLEAFWPAIDCLVVPSRDTPGWIDQSPPFLIEAMGRGIVPIVTKAGALPEIVGPAGIVAADAAGLTEALQPFAADPASCRARSSATRQWVLDRYVTSVVAARTVEFWQAAREHAAPALAHTH